MIIGMEEAREFLRVDGTENDEIIEAILEAIPSEIEIRTGYDWNESDGDAHPMAKQAARFILQLYFDPQTEDSVRLQRTIDNLLAGLTVIGRAEHG